MPFMDPLPEAEATCAGQGTNQPSTDASFNLSWTDLSITSSGGSTFSPGDTAQIEATLKWWSPDGLQPCYYFDNLAKFEFPSGSDYNDVEKAFNDVNISSGPQGTLTEPNYVTFTWDKVIPAEGNPGGQYTVTFTADTDGMFDETNESDNVITSTFTVAAPADTTSATLTASAYFNSTSPTGRTFNVSAVDLEDSEIIRIT